MKNSLKLLWFFSLIILLFSCASTKPLEDGEELVEYREVPKDYSSKNAITPEELWQDCEHMKYILYNCYGGIDESIELGLNLDDAIKNIYEEALAQKDIMKNTISVSNFVGIIRRNLAEKMDIEDQHLYVGGNNVKDSTTIYYSNIYMEKADDGNFYVKKIFEENDKKSAKTNAFTKAQLEEKIHIGDLYTGNTANLYKMILEEGDLYRYGVITKQNLKTANISLNNEKISVPVKNDKVIHQKQAWTNLKQTSDTLYVSLSDCLNIGGLSNENTVATSILDKKLKEISSAAAGKKNIIFDLRSNTGGYLEYPVKMLSAVMYNQHYEDEELIKNIETFMVNSAFEQTKFLVSPFTMQRKKSAYDSKALATYDRLSDERKAMFIDYWKHMKYRPIRKFIDGRDYACNIEELPETDFNGNLYILTNRYTASAAELGTEVSFMFKDKGIDIKLVGENSAGAIKYVGIWNYFLPNSGISFNLASTVGTSPILDSIEQFKGEGKGFYPDVWASSDSILNTLYYLTNDEELLETLKGLDKEML